MLYVDFAQEDYKEMTVVIMLVATLNRSLLQRRMNVLRMELNPTHQFIGCGSKRALSTCTL